MNAEVKIIAQGPVGSGKSALLGEIAIALTALGIRVRYADEAAAQAERNLTHADWLTELEATKPEVVLVEAQPTPTTAEKGAVDLSEAAEWFKSTSAARALLVGRLYNETPDHSACVAAGTEIQNLSNVMRALLAAQPVAQTAAKTYEHLLDVQKDAAKDGDPYHLGLYNGMLLMVANFDNSDYMPLSAPVASKEAVSEAVVRVCPERDVECGRFSKAWCATCPKRKSIPPREEALCNDGQEPDWDGYAKAEAAGDGNQTYNWLAKLEKTAPAPVANAAYLLKQWYEGACPEQATPNVIENNDLGEESGTQQAAPTIAAEGVPSVESPEFNKLFVEYLDVRVKQPMGPDHTAAYNALIAHLNADKAAAVEQLQADLKAARYDADVWKEAHGIAAANVLKLEADIAHERLRADQGWQRYESANADRNQLRAERAAQEAAKPSEGSGDVQDLLSEALNFTQYIAAVASTSRYEHDIITDIRKLQPKLKAAIADKQEGISK